MSSDKVEINDRFWFNATSVMLGKLSKKRARLMEEPEFYLIKRLYEKGEGSWEALSEGDADAWNLLRKCSKTYLKVCKEDKIGPYSPDREEE